MPSSVKYKTKSIQDSPGNSKRRKKIVKMKNNDNIKTSEFILKLTWMEATPESSRHAEDITDNNVNKNRYIW